MVAAAGSPPLPGQDVPGGLPFATLRQLRQRPHVQDCGGRSPDVTGGEPVGHRLWGEGQLLSQDEHELLVYFTSVGYKHLTASALASGILERR